jgi:K+-sensing histidine kinase KdpD
MIYTLSVTIRGFKSIILIMVDANEIGRGGREVKDMTAVLVCVTGQRDCDRLIRAGKKIADDRSIPLQVLCVQPTSAGYETSCEELEHLRQTSRDAKAEMTVYFNDDAALVAVGFVKQIGATHIVTGMAEAPVNGFVEIIHKFLPKVPISMVAKDGMIYNICPANNKRQAAKLAI